MTNWIRVLLGGALLFYCTGCADSLEDSVLEGQRDVAVSPDSLSGAESDVLEPLAVHPGAGAAFDVLLGTGREAHMPLANGDTLYLELGHQGLQHVLVSVRLYGLPQDRYLVDFQLIRDDGVAVSEPSKVRLPFTALSDGTGSECVGYTLVVADPSLAVGHDAQLWVVVVGPDGDLAEDERRVHVEWAPDGWNPDD